MEPLHLHGEDLPEGTPGPMWTFGPVTLTDIVRYAGASGDFTPLHHDSLIAAELGLERVFAMGMMTAGLLGHYAADWLGLARVRRLRVRFKDKTWVGDVLSFGGTILTRDGLGTNITEASLEIVAADGRVVCVGVVEAEIPFRALCRECEDTTGA